MASAKPDIVAFAILIIAKDDRNLFEGYPVEVGYQGMNFFHTTFFNSGFGTNKNLSGSASNCS
jgi:hypothetical protein